jgi:hypothetical protein
MAVSDIGNRINLVASTDIARGRCVMLNATGQATVCTATDDEIVGVTENTATAAGDMLTVKAFTPGFEYEVSVDTAVTFAVTTDNRGNPLALTAAGQVTPGTAQQRFAALASGSQDGLIRVIAVANKYGNF